MWDLLFETEKVKYIRIAFATFHLTSGRFISDCTSKIFSFFLKTSNSSSSRERFAKVSSPCLEVSCSLCSSAAWILVRSNSASDLICALSAFSKSKARSYAGRTPGARGLHHSLGEACEIGARFGGHFFLRPRVLVVPSEGGGALSTGLEVTASGAVVLIVLAQLERPPKHPDGERDFLKANSARAFIPVSISESQGELRMDSECCCCRVIARFGKNCDSTVRVVWACLIQAVIRGARNMRASICRTA